jgi:hypothetical protein
MDQTQMLQIQVEQLQAQARKLQDYVAQKQMILNAKEEQLRRGLLSPDAVQNLDRKMKSSLPSWLSPGNVGDLNQVIWPFMFVSENLSPIAPEQTLRTQFSNTQEASFICTHFTKAVFTYDAITNEELYINPDDQSTPSSGVATDLQFSIRDGLSSREFFNSAANLDEYGHPRFPTRLPAPQFIIPRGTYEITFSNNNPTLYFVPVITFFGYKMRVENADALLSTISG